MNDSFTPDYGNLSINLSSTPFGPLRLGRDGSYYDEQGNKYGVSYSASYGGDSGAEAIPYLVEKAAKPPAWPTPKYADTSSEYWAYDDPRWIQQGAVIPDPYPINDIWDQLLRQAGFAGELYQPNQNKSPNPWIDSPDYERTPEAKAAMDQLRAAGYDVRQKHPDRRTFNTYYGLVTPSGEVQDIKIRGSDLGDAIMPAIKVFGAGLGLAGLGAGINSLLGGAGVAPANALAMDLAGGSADLAGALGGGQFAAAGGLPLTAADLASLPTDVLGQISPIPQVDIANFPSLGDRTVTNVVTPGAQAPGAASTNALAPGPYQNLTPTELLQLDYATTPGLNMGPMPSATGTMSQLQPFPASTAVTVAPPTFEFSPLQDLTAPVSGATGANVGAVAPSIGTIADLAGIPADAGFAAGMGVDAGMNALNLGAGAGAGVLGAGGGGAATAPASTAAGATAAAPIAATAGAAGGGAGIAEGMVPGGLTSAGIPATLPEAAAAGAIAAGAGAGGGSILDQVMSFFKSPAGGAALSGLGSVIGGITQANAAEKAAEQQAQAAQNALALQREMFEYQKGLLEPYRTAGTAALERLSGAMGLGGQAQQQKMLEMDPGYGFRLGEGLKALERMQAARGSMLSGGAMKAGQRYAQDYASGEYGNAYNRLANIAGLGQTTGTQLGTAASQFGQTAGNIMGQEANALAAGRIGRGSAYGSAIQGGLNAYSNYLNQQQQNQLFRDIFGRTAIGS